jgi:hypothetical protein
VNDGRGVSASVNPWREWWWGRWFVGTLVRGVVAVCVCVCVNVRESESDELRKHLKSVK